MDVSELIEVCLGYTNGQKLVAALAIECLTLRYFGFSFNCPAKRMVDSLLSLSPFVLGQSIFDEDDYDDDDDEDDDDDDDTPPVKPKTPAPGLVTV